MESQLKKIIGFRIDNCGQDGAQYWPGRSAMHTDFDEVYVGVGDNSKEAYEDAVGQINEGAEIYERFDFPKNPATISKRDKVSAKDLREQDGEWQCYVAVYIKIAE